MGWGPCRPRGWAACSLNELATEGDATGGGRRVLNVHTGSRTTNNLCDGMRQGGDLGLELCASRRPAFQDGNEHGQFSGIDNGPVFRIFVAPERPETNPGLTRGRMERASYGVSERLREIVPQRAICVSDEFHGDDRHAVQRNKLTGTRQAGDRVERWVRRHCGVAKHRPRRTLAPARRSRIWSSTASSALAIREWRRDGRRRVLA